MKPWLRATQMACLAPVLSTAFVLPPPCHTCHGSETALASFEGTHAESCDVAIMGGGFGGLYTALALSEKARSKGEILDIVLVDPSDRFVFLPLLYDLVVGTASEAEVCPTFDELLEETGIRHIKASFDNFSSSDLLETSIKGTNGETFSLSSQASVVSVGATPQSTLAAIPGAQELTQPFYTRENAEETKHLLDKMELRIRSGLKPRIAVVGGGYGGVELAACLKRRLPQCSVTLLARGPPMKGTRAEPLVDQALSKLGVEVEFCTVVACSSYDRTNRGQVLLDTQGIDGNSTSSGNEPWDAVLWTAGSGPAKPVCDDLLGLKQAPVSGRLLTDNTLRCSWDGGSDTSMPRVWALGDCSEVIDDGASFVSPKTAQAAIQQADVVATNVYSSLKGQSSFQSFKFQDLGSMLTLGGPNAAVLAPGEKAMLGPIFTTALDATRVGLGIADSLFAQVSQSPAGQKSGVGPVVEKLGLSLGGYGLGVDDDSSPGTLSGTLSGAARRAIYALRMPTNRQRAKSAVLGALSTASALTKEVSDQLSQNAKTKR